MGAVCGMQAGSSYQNVLTLSVILILMIEYGRGKIVGINGQRK